MHLSASSVALFDQCPRRFFHEKLEGREKGPSGEAAHIGTYVHAVLEQVAGLPVDERTYDKAVELMRAGWADFMLIPEIMLSDMSEVTLKQQVATGVKGFFKMSDVVVADPVALEMEINLTLDGVPFKGFIDRFVENNGWRVCQDLKGLACDTKIPTPSGFVTMESLQVGDSVFDKDGNEVVIFGKSKIKNLKCYRLKFDDLSEVVCDEEHLWQVMVSKRGKIKEHIVRTIPEIQKIMERNIIYVPLAKGYSSHNPIKPFVDPYVYGAWLGDGKHSSGEFINMDQEIWDRIEAAGFELGKIQHNYNKEGVENKAIARTILGLGSVLKEQGLLGNGKYVPELVYQWSYDNRLELLRGLMDTDGSYNIARNQCVFATTKLEFLKTVEKLCQSLGFRTRIHGPNKVINFDKEWEVYQLIFNPTVCPFHLSYKVAKFHNKPKGYFAVKQNFKEIISIEEIDSVPTVCIAVDSPSRTFLCTEAFTVTHNSGKVPDKRYAGGKLLQLKFYAAALDELDLRCDEIELLYVSYGDRIGCVVTDDTIREAKSVLTSVWDQVNDPLQEWPTKTGPLCFFCPFSSDGTCNEGKIAADKYKKFKASKGIML